MTDAYDFCIEGRLSPELAATFDPDHVRVQSDRTILRCSIRDQSQLFGVVARCETLGLRLVSLTRTSRPED